MFHKYLFNKLVRSYVIDEEMDRAKLSVNYIILSDDEYKNELLRKFHEEVLEVLDAQNKQELIEEIADSYEVIDSILKANNIEKSEVMKVQNAKRNKKGGFGGKYFIKSIIYNNKNPIHHQYLNYIKNKRDGEKYKLFGQFDAHVVDFIITNDARDKIYIQKRSSTRITYPNVWELPGGSIEMGETFRDCIKRA